MQTGARAKANYLNVQTITLMVNKDVLRVSQDAMGRTAGIKPQLKAILIREPKVTLQVKSDQVPSEGAEAEEAVLVVAAALAREKEVEAEKTAGVDSAAATEVVSVAEEGGEVGRTTEGPVEVVADSQVREELLAMLRPARYRVQIKFPPPCQPQPHRQHLLLLQTEDRAKSSKEYRQFLSCMDLNSLL